MESVDATGAQPPMGGTNPSLTAARQNCDENRRVEPSLVSKTKGTDAADPVAESETEMLVSQTPSLFKRGILMDAIP
jgi:hypothetical protein